MQSDENLGPENFPRRLNGTQLRKLLPSLPAILALALGATGCGSPKSGSGAAMDSPPVSHATHGSESGLELNDGVKWAVPPSMMVYLRNIETAVQGFQGTTAQDHATLATNIQENLGQLATHCTMEGKAHDVLHHWLIPFLALATDYSEASDASARQQKLGEIKEALAEFHAYFQ